MLTKGAGNGLSNREFIQSGAVHFWKSMVQTTGGNTISITLLSKIKGKQFKIYTTQKSEICFLESLFFFQRQNWMCTIVTPGALQFKHPEQMFCGQGIWNIWEAIQNYILKSIEFLWFVKYQKFVVSLSRDFSRTSCK